MSSPGVGLSRRPNGNAPSMRVVFWLYASFLAFGLVAAILFAFV
jgi:hypothetical protein